MLDLNEARRNLELLITEEQKKQYFALLKQWFLFKNGLTKIQFDSAARKLLPSDEQIHAHNVFFLLLMNKIFCPKIKTSRSVMDKGSFELADYTPSSPITLPPDFENRSAAAELFLPDSSFMATRIAVHTWDNGLEGAQENVTDYLVHACQTFVKNIVTAMISRKEGYRIRDGKLQHAVGVPVPDPFIRNTNNMFESDQESKVDVLDDDDGFAPSVRNTIERMEQEVAFSYSCSKGNSSDKKLTVKLLYDTLREDPSVVPLHTVQSLNLIRLGLSIEN